MAATIEKFLSKNARRDRVARFEELSKGKTQEEIRIMEMALLKPDEIPDYVGEVNRYNLNSETTVKLVFRTPEEMEMVGKHLSINNYIEPCISDIKIVLDLFMAIERGEISYNKKAGKFTFCEKEPAPNPKCSVQPKQLPPQEKNNQNTDEGVGVSNSNPLRRFLRRREA